MNKRRKILLLSIILATLFLIDIIENFDYIRDYYFGEKGVINSLKTDNPQTVYDKYERYENIAKLVVLVAVGFSISIVLIGHVMDGDFYYGTERKTIPKYIPDFINIPCKNDILRAYYIGYRYGIIKKKTDILGAMILKWIKDGMIRIENNKRIYIAPPKENSKDFFETIEEESLFDMFYLASRNGNLEYKELQSLCELTINSKRTLSWFDNIISDEEKKLISEGLIEVESEKKMIFVQRKNIATPELKQEAIELAGLKKYLQRYKNVNEREFINVDLLEDYLIFAQMLGESGKITKWFKELYPEMIQQSNFVSYDDVCFINRMSNRAILAAKIEYHLYHKRY